MKEYEYALYKGEECLAIGTIKEIAEQTKVKVKTIRFYLTPTYKKRGLGDKSKNKRILIKLEDE